MVCRSVAPLLLLLVLSVAVLVYTGRVGPGSSGLFRLTNTTILYPQAAAYTTTTLSAGERTTRALLLPQINITTDPAAGAVSAGEAPARMGGVEEGLARARAAIRRAAASGGGAVNATAPNVYRNAKAFFRSYAEMEKRFKVFVYEEGEAPLLHDGPCKDIYTTEGRFIQDLEMTPMEKSGGASSLRTSDPKKAHAFFLPFSVSMLVKYVYIPDSHDHTTIKKFVADYIHVIATKYGFWNRTSGADHFMLSCHDWGPNSSMANHDLYNTAIRALCNANTSEGFVPRKDVSIPEINLISGDVPRPLRSMPPESSPRPYLAFFAGGLHGPIREFLLEHWKEKDDDLRVHEYLPKGVDYHSFMLKSRFCLCPSGWEVASPRIVESIYAGCVPVILSKAYVLPFNDVLRWEEFSLTVPVEDIPRLKEVLQAVPEEEVKRLRSGVRAVRRHFIFNQPAKKFDVFHMIMHSVWLRRLNARVA